MFQKMKARMLRILPAVAVSVLLVTGVLYAWTEPPVTPPNGNASAPLNVGSAGQNKLGNLMLNSGGILANALLIPFGKVGIGPVASVDNPPYDPLKLVDLGNSGRIVRVNNPIDAQDVATKAYVDAASGGSSGLKIVKNECTTTTSRGGSGGYTCTVTVDCGAGWQIIACGESHSDSYGGTGTFDYAGTALYGYDGTGQGAAVCRGSALGNQQYSTSGISMSNTAKNVIIALCAKQ